MNPESTTTNYLAMTFQCCDEHRPPNTSSAYNYSSFDHTNSISSNFTTSYSLQHVVLSSIIVSIILLAIIVGNALVIVAIAVDPSLKGLQNWFIASLAVSDLFVGLFVMPLSLANELMGYWVFGDVVCELWLSTDVLLCTASILNLCLISLDRYWSITRAVQYIKQRTRRRAVVMISIVWVLSMVICLPPLVGWKRPQPENDAGLPLCVLSEEIGYVIYSSVGSFYLPLALMVLVYFKIYLAARDHARRNLKKKRCGGQPPEVTTYKSSSTNTTSFSSGGAARCKVKNSELFKPLQERVSGERDDDQAIDQCLPVGTNEREYGKTEEYKVSDRESVVQNIGLLSECENTQPCCVDEPQPAATMNGDHYSVSYMLKYRFLFSDDSASDCSLNTKRSNALTSHNRRPNFLGLDHLANCFVAETNNDRQNTFHNISAENAINYQNFKYPVVDLTDTALDINSHSDVVDADISVIVNPNFIHLSTDNLPPHQSPSREASSISETTYRENQIGPGKLFSRICAYVRHQLFRRICCLTPKRQRVSVSVGHSQTKQTLDEPLLESEPEVTSKHSEQEQNGSRGHQQQQQQKQDCGSVKQTVMPDDRETARKKIARARERRATVVLGIVMASFIGCWLPFFFIYPLSLTLDVQVPESVFAVIFWLGYCNSALNPIIYTIFNREFRQAFSALIFGRRRWGGRR